MYRIYLCSSPLVHERRWTAKGVLHGGLTVPELSQTYPTRSGLPSGRRVALH